MEVAGVTESLFPGLTGEWGIYLLPYNKNFNIFEFVLQVAGLPC